MTDLLKLQRDFSKHIFVKSDKKILQEIIYSDVEAQERLNIYRNNVLGNFESILSDIFAVSKKMIGEKKFAELINKYCQKFPSKSGDLNEFGSEFPTFVKSLKPLYLKDLAQLELLYHQSYFAKKSTLKFDLEKFKKLSPEKFSNLTFELDSAAILFASKFSVFSIWQKERAVKNFLKPEFVLIQDSKIFSISEEEFLFLLAVQQKKSLYQIYQKLSKKFKKEIDIGSLVNHFVSGSTIVKFKV